MSAGPFIGTTLVHLLCQICKAKKDNYNSLNIQPVKTSVLHIIFSVISTELFFFFFFTSMLSLVCDKINKILLSLSGVLFLFYLRLSIWVLVCVFPSPTPFFLFSSVIDLQVVVILTESPQTLKDS